MDYIISDYLLFDDFKTQARWKQTSIAIATKDDLF